MRDVLSKMGRHGLAFAVGLMLTRLVGFLLAPFLSKALSEAEYGVTDNLALAANLLMLIAAQGVPSGLFRNYAYTATEGASKGRAIATAFRYTLLSSSTLLITAGMCAVPLSLLLLGDTKYWVLLVLVLITYLFANLKNVCNQILRADYRSSHFLTVSCTEFILCAGLNLLFVVKLGLGPAGIIYSNLIGAAVALVLAVRYVPQSITDAYDKSIRRDMTSFGWPLVPQAVVFSLLNSADRFIFVAVLGSAAGLEASGLYGRGQSFATILDGVLLMPFMMLWPSVYYEVGKRPSAARDLGRCGTYYVAVACFLALGLTFVAEPLVHAMLDARYHEAHVVVPILAFAYACYGFSDVTKVGMLLVGKTKRMPLLVAGAAIVNVIVNFGAISRFGILGAAWASFAAFATLALLAGIASQRLFRIDYEWSRLVRIVAAALILVVLERHWTFAPTEDRGQLVLELLERGSCAALAFPLLLILFRVPTSSEYQTLWNLFRRVLGRPAA